MVDPRAAAGFSAAVAAYERGRPSYPPEAVSRLAAELSVTPASTVLDLAAGTGKLTDALLGIAGRVVAVDPSPAMLAALSARLPAVDARNGSAEAIPLADGTVDAVFVGEAFHWFRTAEACAEIARVLVAGGGLALLWNRSRWTEEELPWLPAFNAVVTPPRLAAGAFPAGGDTWRPALDATGRFAPLSSAEVSHVQRLDADGLVALVASWSWIANLPDPERKAILEQVRRLVSDAPELSLPYRTELHWTRRS